MQEAVIKAFADKVPKVVVAAVDIVTTALRSAAGLWRNLLQAYSIEQAHTVLTCLFMQPLWGESCVPTASSQITS